MKMWKKAAGILLAVLVAAGILSGCQGSAGKESTTAQTAAAKEGVVTDDRIALGNLASDASLYFSVMQRVGDRVYGSGYYYRPNGDSSNILCSFLPDGTDFRIINESRDGYQAVCFQADGSWYAVLMEYQQTEDTAQDETVDTEDSADTGATSAKIATEEYFPEVTDMTIYLVKYDPAGKELWRNQIKNWDDQGDYFYVYGIAVLEGQGVLLASEKSLGVFSQEDGTFIRSISLPDTYDCGMSPKEDGSVMVRAYTEKGVQIYTIDKETGSLSEPALLPDAVSGRYQIQSGRSTDLLLTDDKGIYTMNLGDQEPALKVSFANSDMDVQGVANVLETDDGYIVLYYDASGETGVHILTPVAPEDVADKKVLTLGCYYVDSDVRSAVVRFNRESENYRIQIRDYSSYDNYESDKEEDWNAGATQLNNDIISGNLPDILVLNTNMPVQSYVQKGVFEDLSAFLDKDPDLKREDYFGNIFDAVNPDGKLYVLFPSFSIQALAARTADVGEKGAISVKDLQKLAESRGIAAQNIFGLDARPGIIANMLELNGASYIDMEKGTCSFDQGEFRDFLEFVSAFPAEYPEESSEDFWENYDLLWRDGKALIRSEYIGDFRTFRENRSVYFDTDQITYMGFPAAEGSSPAVNANLQMAMSAGASDKDACWQFLRGFISEAYQDSITYGFPVRRSSFRKMGEEAMKKPTMTDENGKEVEYDDTYYVKEGMEIVVDPLRPEELEMVTALIETLDHSQYYDSNVSTIIEEETSAFFSGEKTAEEVAGIIQSRVQIYINENR